MGWINSYHSFLIQYLDADILNICTKVFGASTKILLQYDSYEKLDTFSDKSLYEPRHVISYNVAFWEV